jgi:DNA-binding transcriptional MocR family regulator
MSKPYVLIADRIAHRIADGDLAVGTRLPPQRIFAFKEGIAVSTASRVYEELRRRGLVQGEVGRGTYVASRFAPLDPSLQERSASALDLEIVFCLGAEARSEIAASTTRFFRAGLVEGDAAPPLVRGSADARKALAGVMSGEGPRIDPDTVLIAGSGKQALAASLAALAPRGGRIAVEALTYPFVIATARQLGIDLVPLPLDGEGVVPAALDHAASEGLCGVYLQPTLQSPLVLTMSHDRRASIAEVLVRRDLIAIEDRVYGFLRSVPPIAGIAPDHVVQVDSLSKRLMPGLSVGMIAAPVRLHDPLARAVRAGGWMATSLAVALARHWIGEGLVGRIETAKRQEAAAMYHVAIDALHGVEFRGAPDALHGWIALPQVWRGDAFTKASACLGIAVAPGRAFAVAPGAAPAGVRIAYSAPDLETWRLALRELGRLVLQGPQQTDRAIY